MLLNELNVGGHGLAILAVGDSSSSVASLHDKEMKADWRGPKREKVRVDVKKKERDGTRRLEPGRIATIQCLEDFIFARC